MKSAAEILTSHGIGLRRITPGNQKTTCPRCSPGRKNKREPCLSVEIANDGVRFNCHHCGYHGGEFYDERTGAKRGQGVPKPDGRSGHRKTFRGLYG